MEPQTESLAEIDRLTASFFALFTNRDGAVPELGRIYDLFVPAGVIANCAGSEPVVTDLAGFIAPRQQLLISGRLVDFAEWEMSGTTSIFGAIAQRVSLYEKSGVREGAPFAMRGTKTLQFVRTAAGWRILSVAWVDDVP